METWKNPIKSQLKSDAQEPHPGDQVEIYYRVVEGDKERIQVFSGTVIKLRGADVSRTFTVRRVGSAGVGVERIFPLHSPYISQIKLNRRGKVRRAKLYYLRQLKGKASRLREQTERPE